ncbi:hypothetical protein BH10PSE5_BH10PSE5_12220 [soil metagenome]
MYRQMGRSGEELQYALIAYQQDPASPAVLNTLFRALEFSGSYRLITNIYGLCRATEFWIEATTFTPRLRTST